MYLCLYLDFRLTFTNRTYIASKNYPQLMLECPSNADDYTEVFPINITIDEVDDTAIGESA